MATFQPLNAFALGDEAYNAGRARAQQQGVTNAFQMVNSDPAGAQQQFLRYGAPEQATAVGKIVQAKRQQDARTQAQTQVQGGDVTGGAQTLAVNGMGEDAAALTKIGDDQLAQAQKKADTLGALAHYFQQLPQEQRAQAWQDYAPVMIKQGLVTADQAANPKLDDNNLQAVQAQALGLKQTLDNEEKRRTQQLAERKQTFEENKPITVAAGGNLVSPTGQQIYSAPAYHTVAKGGALIETGGASAPGQPQSAAAPQAGAPQAQGDPNAPRGLRNNNPLNVTVLPQGHAWDGQTGADGQYAVFSSPEAGLAAADRNLQTYGEKHGINTLAGVISRWAPKSENDTASYIATVSKDLNVDPNQPLDLSNPQVRRAVLTSMSKVELGHGQAAQPPAQPPGPQPQGQPAAAGGSRVVYQAPPEPDDAVSLTPQTIQQLAETVVAGGQMPAFGMGKQATAMRQAVLNKVGEIRAAGGVDGYQAAEQQASLKANSAALGQVSRQRNMIESFENTAAKNGDLMLSLAPKGAGPTGVPVLNRWLQAGRKQVAGDADVSNFDIALGTFADEYAKVVTGGTGSQAVTDSARREAYDRLSKFASQGQLAGGVQTMKAEMGNRIGSLKDQEGQLRDTIRTSGRPKAAAAAGGVTGGRPSLDQIFGR